MTKNNAHSSELYTGSIPLKLLFFVIPLILTGLLQLFYNAADMIVVGRFAGTAALSAVGATSQLINLFINLFTGLALGASVVASRYFGANDFEALDETVHTAIALSIVGGIVITIIGCIFARPILIIMDTPEDVLEGAVSYIRIFFCGMVFNMVYNYGAALLRAVGDTKRPLFFLTISGIVNVILNLIFVIVFNMGIAGVGFATIASQAVSMAFILNCLAKSNGPLKLYFKKIKFHKDKLFMMLKFGLPAGVQSSLFAFSNVIVQSSINIFGTAAVAGSTASSNIEGFLMVISNSFNQANIAFISQNIGAKQFTRVRKGFFSVACIALVIDLSVTLLVLCNAEFLVGLYTTDPAVIAYGVERMFINITFHFLCMFMNIFAGQMQSLGHSLLAMIISINGSCVFRMGWVFTIFKANPSLPNLYTSYPVSWGVTALVHLTFILYFLSRLPKKDFDLPSKT